MQSRGLPKGVDLRRIEPGSPKYASARELRYESLYAHLGLPRSLVEDTDGRAYVHLAAIEVGGDVVGYARLHLEGGASKIYQVCVAPEWRCQGIATALVRELMRLAVEQGRTEITLDARMDALPVYEKLGFVAVGEEFLSERTGTPHRAMRRAL